MFLHPDSCGDSYLFVERGLMSRDEESKAKSAFERSKAIRDETKAVRSRTRLDQLTEKKPDAAQKRISSDGRLRRLREQEHKPPEGPELDR